MKEFCSKCNAECDTHEKVIGGVVSINQEGESSFIPTLIQYICTICENVIRATFNGRHLY
jgi:hypothetical protein